MTSDLYDPSAVADRLHQLLLKEWHRDGVSDADREFATEAINFVLHAKATLLYSPAAALIKRRPVVECSECGEPVTYMSGKFGSSIAVGYGTGMEIITPDGHTETGGLEMAVIRNEKGIFIGLPRHGCNAGSSGRKLLADGIE